MHSSPSQLHVSAALFADKTSLILVTEDGGLALELVWALVETVF